MSVARSLGGRAAGGQKHSLDVAGWGDGGRAWSCDLNLSCGGGGGDPSLTQPQQ